MTTTYTPTIGLEVHAELNTKSKMFCGSINDPDEKRPNVNICPVCMGHPGTLPVVNKEAVKHVLTIGHAVGGDLADYTEFDRKNYFYPDIPKGYQISQYKYPLVSNGKLAGVELTRIHLEEDTARSTHEEGYSLVDYNRAGLPLMELVTEPVIHSAEEAGKFARELQLLLRTLGIAHANMEKGEMRVEANISVSSGGELGTKVEVKNLNSFRAVERAIAYEIDRHITLLESGEEIVQETRGWDEGKQATFSQRTKEDAHDYRYFPDPDIPSFKLSEISEFAKEIIVSSMPELPNARRERYSALGLKSDDVEFLVSNIAYQTFFEGVLNSLKDNNAQIKLAVNYLVSDIAGHFADSEVDFSNLTPEHFAELMTMVDGGELSSRGAKDVLKILLLKGGKPRFVAEKEGLFQQSDEGALQGIVDSILKEHTGVVEEYKAGKEASLQFLIGQGMKATKGSANPQALKALFEKTILG